MPRKKSKKFSYVREHLLTIIPVLLIILAIPVTILIANQKTQLQQQAAGLSMPIDGQGLYDSCTPWGTTDTNGCFSKLDKMASGGFKLVVNYSQLYGNASGELAYLDHVQADGMKVIFAINDPAFWNGTDLRSKYPDLAATCNCTDNTGFITYVINLVKNHTALWGYYVGDETAVANHDQLKTFTDLVKQLDPAHPRLLVETTENTGGGASGATSILTTFQDTADVLSVNYYPVGSSGNGESVAQTASVAAAVQSVSNQYGKQSGMVLQSFSWSEYANEAWRCPGYTTCPYPTLSDLETMLNLTVQNSTPRIILWYSYFDILKSDNPSGHWSDLTAAISSIQPTLTSSPTATPTLTKAPTMTPTPTISLTPTPTPNTTLNYIYNDSLTNGWSNVSSTTNNSLNFSSTTKPYTGTKDIAWTAKVGGAYINLHNNTSINASKYNYITFAVYATQAGAKLAIRLLDQNSNPLSSFIPLTSWGDPIAGTYKVYTIPLSSLNATGKLINGIHLLNNTSTSQPVMYVDRVGFN